MLTRICRSVAAAAVLLLVVLGAVVLAAVSPAALIGVIGIGTIVGLIVAIQLPGTEAPALSRPRRHAAGTRTAAIVVSALLVMAGSGALLGAAAAPVLLLLIAGVGAGAWRHRAAWRAYITAGTLAEPPAGAPGTPLRLAAPASLVRPGALTLWALCQAWHHSQQSLLVLPAGPTRSELLSTRERLLDELERRDPVGFRRWLHRGVYASSDPGTYLNENRTSTARIPRGNDPSASS